MLTFWLTRDHAEHWGYMPHVLARIRRFCKEYGSVANPEHLVQQAMNHFVLSSPLVAAMVLLDESNGEIVGHLLCEITDWAGSRYGIILQYQLDRPMPEKDRIAGFGVVEDWAKAAGAWGVQIFARTPVHARAFRRYGLVYDATLMRKGVPPQLPVPVDRGATIPSTAKE